MTLPDLNPDENLALRHLLQKLTERDDDDLSLRAREILDHWETPTRYSDERARLIALYEVSRTLGSSLQIDAVLSQVMDAVIQLTGAERGFLMMLDDVTHELNIMAARHLDRKDLERDEMEVSRTIIHETLESGQGVVTTNAQTDERYADRDSITRYALRSILCEPLKIREEIIGVLYVDNKVREGVFGSDDSEMLKAFASQAAVAIENAKLFTQIDESLERRVAELEMLQQIDRELNSGLDYKRMLEHTLQWAVQGTHASSGWIAVLAEDERTMQVEVGEGKEARVDTHAPYLQPAIEKGKLVQRTPSSEESGLEVVAPIRREDQTIGLIAIFLDATSLEEDARLFITRLADHAAVALENTRLYRAAQQADRAKSQFISIASHELKIPLTSIRGFADLIRQGAVGPVTDQQAKFLDTIRDNVDRMANLVSDLADISRIETGRMRIEIIDLSLSDYVRETVAVLRPQFEDKKQSIKVSLPDGLPMVRADRARLVQILTNLLSNANKYTPEGGRVEITAHHVGDFAQISVRDNGIGLSESDQAMLFSQFFRSDEPAVREEVGWGLGLYVTHRLVELLDGEIGVESRIGEGSTFWFTLPIAHTQMENSI